jgi:hypothetical protein
MLGEKFVADFLTRLTDFNDGKTDLCIHCGKQVKSLEKIGRCVYARPCGCRLWQGGVPKAWKDREVRRG